LPQVIFEILHAITRSIQMSRLAFRALKRVRLLATQGPEVGLQGLSQVSV